MNSQLQEPISKTVTGDEPVHICIAFSAPREHASVSACGLDNSLMFVSGVSLLELLLQKENLAIDGVGGVGDFADGVMRLQTRRRDDALKVIGEWRERFIVAQLGSVAWYDSSEGAWRLSLQGAWPIGWDEFLTPERDAARVAVMQCGMDRIRKLTGLQPPTS